MCVRGLLSSLPGSLEGLQGHVKGPLSSLPGSSESLQGHVRSPSLSSLPGPFEDM